MRDCAIRTRRASRRPLCETAVVRKTVVAICLTTTLASRSSARAPPRRPRRSPGAIASESGRAGWLRRRRPSSARWASNSGTGLTRGRRQRRGASAGRSPAGRRSGPRRRRAGPRASPCPGPGWTCLARTTTWAVWLTTTTPKLSSDQAAPQQEQRLHGLFHRLRVPGRASQVETSNPAGSRVTIPHFVVRPGTSNIVRTGSGRNSTPARGNGFVPAKRTAMRVRIPKTGDRGRVRRRGRRRLTSCSRH